LLPTNLRLLVIVPSVVTIGFGAWHFVVPSVWDWYGAIMPEATELVLAVRAINFLFSLCLVLQGGVTIALVLRQPTERFALTLMLGASTIVWGSRVVLQLAYPQGTQIPGVAPGMLFTFVLTFLAFAGALVVLQRTRGAGVATRR
jgi:hypothetical protein